MINQETTMYKLCTKCKIVKEINGFNKHSRTKDGLQNTCKVCIKLQYEASKKTGLTAMQKQRLLRKDAVLESSRRYREKHRDVINAKRKEYVKNNRAKINARKAKYRAIKLQATPDWLTKDDFEKIEHFYIEARKLSLQTGVQYHVDHIVPLRGDLICGLHVPWNLQILTARENRLKKNKYEV